MDKNMIHSILAVTTIALGAILWIANGCPVYVPYRLPVHYCYYTSIPIIF